MSLAAMHWARQSLKTLPDDVKAPARLALMLLSDYADEAHVCWPSIGVMALEMGCSTRSVQRAIDVLEARSLLSVEKRLASNGRQQSNRYHLAVGLGCQSVTPTTSTSDSARGEGDNLTPYEGDKLTGEGDTTVRGRVTPVSPLESTTRNLPPNPSHSGAGETQAPDWFGQGLADDGQPLGEPADQVSAQPGPAERQQSMTLDWEPDSATWQRACWERGLEPDADVHQPLLDFREHFAAQMGRTATHADWTRRFARWVHENQRRQAPATGGAHHGNVSRQRTPARRLTAAEARERDRRAHQGGDVYDGQFAPIE